MVLVRPRVGAVSRLTTPRWLDPLTIVVAVAALAVYLPRGFQGALTRDLALYAYAGQQFAEGVPPYVGVLNRAGPLAHALPGVGTFVARLADVDDVVGTRALFLLFAVGCVVLAYLVARQLFDSPLAGLVSAAALLTLQGFSELAAYGPREKTPMVLLVYLAAWATLHRRWATAGSLVSLATLTWQPAFFVAGVVAAVAALLLEPGSRLRALGRIVAGGLAPLALLVAVYAALGQLRTFLDAFVLINLRHTTQPSVWDRPVEVWEAMGRGYGWGLWVLLAGWLALLVLAAAAAVALRGAAPTDWRTRMVLALGLGLAGGVAWSNVAFNNWPDALVLIPPATLGLGGLVPLFARRLPSPVAVGVVLTLVVPSVVAAGVDSARSADDQMVAQRASTEAVLRHLDEGATLLSVQAPGALVFAERRNPTPYQMFTSGLADHMEESHPGGMAGYADRVIHEEAPTVIAVKGGHPWLRPSLRLHYRRAGAAPRGWTWWVRRSVPESTIADIRRDTRRILRTMKRSSS